MLAHLDRAAHAIGRMPGQAPEPKPAYFALAHALDQLDYLPADYILRLTENLVR